MIYLSKKGTFSSDQSHWHSQQEHIFCVYFPTTLIEEKNHTPASARSTRTDKKKWKKLQENLHAPVPPHRAFTKVHFEIVYNYIIFEHVFLEQKLPFWWYILRPFKTATWFLLLIFLYIFTKKNVPVQVPGHWALTKVHFEIVYNYIIFEHVFLEQTLPFWVVYLQAIQNKNMIFVVNFSLAHSPKKTYGHKCPVTGHS